MLVPKLHPTREQLLFVVVNILLDIFEKCPIRLINRRRYQYSPVHGISLNPFLLDQSIKPLSLIKMKYTSSSAFSVAPEFSRIRFYSLFQTGFRFVPRISLPLIKLLLPQIPAFIAT